MTLDNSQSNKPEKAEPTNDSTASIAPKVVQENHEPSTVKTQVTNSDALVTQKVLPGLEFTNLTTLDTPSTATAVSELVTSSANRIKRSLDETQQWTGRSQVIIEKDLRDSLRLLTPEQIEKLKDTFQTQNGISLEQAFRDNSTISTATKETLSIYLQKSITGQSKLETLADVALKSNNFELFAETMSGATSSERAIFLQQKGNELAKSFSGNELEKANDLARLGHLSTEKQITDNTGYVWNNYQGIDLAINRMTSSERSDYLIGQSLTKGTQADLSNGESIRLKDMNTEDKQRAIDFYTHVHQSLEAAGNSTQVATWDTLIANRDSALAKSLLGHRGFFYNSSAADIQKSIEEISESDWTKAKENPAESKRNLEATLQSLNLSSGDIANLLTSFDKKLQANSFAESRDTGKRSILDTLDNNWHWYGNDQRAMLDALASMSAEDRMSYRNDPKMKASLDEKVDSYFSSEQKIQALHILSEIAVGNTPRENILTSLAKHASDFSTDQAEVIRNIRDAIKADPQLRERLANPISDEDKQFRTEFERLAKQNLGDADFNKYIGELIATGDLSAKKIIALSNGTFTTDKENTFKDIALLSSEERKHLLQDQDYQDEVLGHLSSEHRKIALRVAEQGEYRAEDKIRSLVAGYGGSDEIVKAIKEIPATKLQELQTAYETKYGASLKTEVATKLSSQQNAEVLRYLAKDSSIATRLDLARDEAYATRSGFGAGFIDFVSVTGEQADDSLNQLISGVADKNRASTEGESAARQTPAADSTIDLITNFDQAIDNNRAAKASAAEATTNTLIAAAAVAATIVTAGANIPMTAAILAAGGSAGRVGTKGLILGQDYDWRIASVAQDATVGAAMGATAILGPAEAAAVFKIGQVAAQRSAASSIALLSTKEGLTEGYDQVLQTGMQETMRQLLASGATKVDERAFAALAEKCVATSITGEARKEAVANVQKTISEQATLEFSKETANWLVHQARAQGLNAAGGTGGGGISGGIEGATDWKFNGSLQDNLNQIGAKTAFASLTGGFGALAMGSAIKGAEFAFLKTPHVPTPIQPEALAQPNIHSVDTVNSNSFVAANDSHLFVVDQKTLPTAANDNWAWEEERLVMNGGSTGSDRPRATLSMPGRPQQTTFSTVSADRPQLNRGSSADAVKDTSVKAPSHLSEVKKTGGQPASEEQLREIEGLERQARAKAAASDTDANVAKQYEAIANRINENLTWLKSQKDSAVDKAAYADLIKLNFSVSKQQLTIPLEALRDADPSTLRFVRDRFTEVAPTFKRDVANDNITLKPFNQIRDPQTRAAEIAAHYGDRYEFAMNKQLTDLLNGPDRNGVFKYDVNGTTKEIRLKDYIYIPGSQGSAMDHAGIDGLFVKISNGQVTPIDIKSSLNAESRVKANGSKHDDSSKIFPGAPSLGIRQGFVFDQIDGRNLNNWENLELIFNEKGGFRKPVTTERLGENLGLFLGGAGKRFLISDIPITKFPSADANLSADAIRQSLDTFTKAANDSSSPNLKLIAKKVTDSRSGINKTLEEKRVTEGAALASQRDASKIAEPAKAKPEIKAVPVEPEKQIADGAKSFGLELQPDEAFYLTQKGVGSQMENPEVLAALLKKVETKILDLVKTDEEFNALAVLTNPNQQIDQGEMDRLSGLFAADLKSSRPNIDDVRARVLANGFVANIEAAKAKMRTASASNDENGYAN